MKNERAQPLFTVQRHGGRSGDTWHSVGEPFDNEADAKEAYRKIRRKMRLGGLALCDSRGITLMKHWMRP